MDEHQRPLRGLPAMKPGDVLLHERGTAVGVMGADGRLYTHNMDLAPHQARRFSPCTLEQVPGRLRGYLEAARRRAARGVKYGEQG